MNALNSKTNVATADHGYAVCGYDRDQEEAQEQQVEAGNRTIHASHDLESLLGVLLTPRVIMFLVPAGQIVELVVRELTLHLGRGDELPPSSVPDSMLSRMPVQPSRARQSTREEHVVGSTGVFLTRP
jgi:hypothetical protein